MDIKKLLIFLSLVSLGTLHAAGDHYYSVNQMFPVNEMHPIIAAEVGQNQGGNIQDLKSLYIEKCSSCHTISKSNYANDILPSDWKDTVARMAALPNANISGSDQTSIYDYLVYDSATRRKIKLDQQVLALPPDRQESEKAMIVEVLRRYGALK